MRGGIGTSTGIVVALLCMESGVDAGASDANKNKSPTGPNSCRFDGTGAGAEFVNIARCCDRNCVCGHCALKWSSAPHSSQVIISPCRLRGFLRLPFPFQLVRRINGLPP